MSSESDTKELMKLLGDELCTSLKLKFERELQMQIQTDALKDCDLRKCNEEKKAYKELYQLYKQMIAEMQQMAWCNTCSANLNIDANDLKIGEVEARLKKYQLKGDKIGLDEKKELTNQLLE